jgi:hypothetical protein
MLAQYRLAVGNWDALRAQWQWMPHSTRPGTRRLPRQRASGWCAFPNRSTKSLDRKREQKNRWFRNGQRWRTGSEGSAWSNSDAAYVGMDRWVGLGVIADNVVDIGRAMAKQAGP